MNKESTRLQALQVQQQLGIQALSIANGNSQSILSLFRGNRLDSSTDTITNRAAPTARPDFFLLLFPSKRADFRFRRAECLALTGH